MKFGFSRIGGAISISTFTFESKKNANNVQDLPVSISGTLEQVHVVTTSGNLDNSKLIWNLRTVYPAKVRGLDPRSAK